MGYTAIGRQEDWLAGVRAAGGETDQLTHPRLYLRADAGVASDFMRSIDVTMDTPRRNLHKQDAGEEAGHTRRS